MLGKERNSNTNQDPFMDEAWLKMSELLDQEMPVATQADAVEPKSSTTTSRFRYAYVLLFLLIGFVAGAGLMLLWTEQQQPESPSSTPVETAPPPEKAKTPMAVNNGTIDQQSMLAGQYTPPRGRLEAGFGPSTKVQPPKVPDDLAASKRAQPPDRSSPPTALHLAKPNQKAKGITELNNLYDLNSTLPKTNSTTSFTTTINASKAEAAIHSLADDDLSQELIPLVPQEAKSIDYWSETNRLSARLSLLDESLETPSLLTQLPKKARKWEVGLLFGSLSESWNEASGLTAGIYVKYQMDRRFGLRTGLAYAYLNKLQETQYTRSDYSSNIPVVTGPNTLGDTVTISESPAPNLPDFAANLPIYSMEYLQVPILLTFSPQRRIQIESGLQLGWLFRMQQGSMDAQVTGLPISADQFEEGIRQLDVAAMVGLGLQIIPRLNLGLHYQYGMMDYTKTDFFGIRRVDAHQYWQLSMRYNIGNF